jgi:hypothetical protein
MIQWEQMLRCQQGRLLDAPASLSAMHGSSPPPPAPHPLFAPAPAVAAAAAAVAVNYSTLPAPAPLPDQYHMGGLGLVGHPHPPAAAAVLAASGPASVLPSAGDTWWAAWTGPQSVRSCLWEWPVEGEGEKGVLGSCTRYTSRHWQFPVLTWVQPGHESVCRTKQASQLTTLASTHHTDAACNTERPQQEPPRFLSNTFLVNGCHLPTFKRLGSHGPQVEQGLLLGGWGLRAIGRGRLRLLRLLGYLARHHIPQRT